MEKSIWSVICLSLLCIAIPLTATAGDESNEKAGGAKSLEERVQQLEEALGRDAGETLWFERIQLSGVIEVEAAHQNIDFNNPAVPDEETNDVDLAAVELGVDAGIVDHVDGHVLFKYEDDDVFLDEGFITLTGTESFPAYLVAGRQYIPFGNFDSHFITDPATLTLGETNNGAAVAGCRFGDELVDISAGVFNGRVNEIGSGDTIGNFVAAIVAAPLDGVSLGVSYLSNLAASDGLSEVVTDVDGDGQNDNIASLVGAWSAFVTLEFMDRFRVIGEYLAALDDFNPGEIYSAAETLKRSPAAWNAELGVAVMDTLEIAARYGGSDDGGDFLPESEYGAVVNWGLFKNTNLALEYLHGEFENDQQDTDTFTAQLAVEF